MSFANMTVIVLVFGAIGWGLGLAVTNNPTASIGGAVGGGIAGVAFCDWLRRRFRSHDSSDGEAKR